MTAMLDFVAQFQNSIPEVRMGLRTVLYRRTLMSIDRLVGSMKPEKLPNFGIFYIKTNYHKTFCIVFHIVFR